MSAYPKPNTSADYRADAAECLDRAQRALEVTEVNLDKVAELLVAQAANRSIPVTYADLIAHAEARTRVAAVWSELAVSKNCVGGEGG